MELALQRQVYNRRPLEGGRTVVLAYVSRPQREKLRKVARRHHASVSEVVRALIDTIPDDDDTS